MSVRNGDKARFGRERKRKIHERQRIRELRKAMEIRASRPTLAAPEPVSITSLALEPVG